MAAAGGKKAEPPKPPPSAAVTAFGGDRTAAAFVIGKGGSVDLAGHGGGFPRPKGPGVQTLYLVGQSVPDPELLLIQGLPSLAALDLSRSPVTAAGLAYLGKFPRLAELSLIGVTAFTDTGIKILSRSPNLAQLNVRTARRRT